MVNRRLAGSEAERAAASKEFDKLQKGQSKIAEKIGNTEEEFAHMKTRLGEQLTSNVGTTQLKFKSELARQLGGLALSRGQMEEQAISGAGATNLALQQMGLLEGISGEQQIGALGAEGERLRPDAERSKAGAFFGGLGDGLIGGLSGGGAASIAAGMFGKPKG